MTSLDSVLDKAKVRVTDKVQATVPVDRQVQAAHLMLKAKRLVGVGKPLVFTEQPIPDPYDVPLTEIDVSNPFMNRQGKWYPYFARLREEAPVHYLVPTGHKMSVRSRPSGTWRWTSPWAPRQVASRPTSVPGTWCRG